ncbi:MAG TPA: serine/threonine-protein kinase [Polyangiaceae bacterium]|jgi:serine/threonine-protein kinase|nr:serine/threonine-protein kinase [Polyangiaceae bacterium]
MGEARRTCPTCGEAYGSDALFCPRDGAPLAARKPDALGDPYLGLHLGSDLHLQRLVGIGSMGRVYRASQSSIGRPVAVKILHREHMKRRDLVARFLREGRVAGGLSHPNLITVHGSGELTPSPGETSAEPYIVMEFLDGMTLRSALAATEGVLPPSRALGIVLSISDAVGEAHARDIVHRDLKPENVMLVRVGADPDFVKVLDFGVARVGEADSSIATHAGAILGTALYACPESARGERVGAPGDVYSLATLLFECLAGKPPFVGAGPVDVLIQHAQAAPPDVRSLGAGRDVPAPLARFIEKNLAKNPNDRAPDARTFGQGLAEAARASGFDGAALTRRATLLGGATTRADAPAGGALTSSVTRKTLRDLGTRDA